MSFITNSILSLGVKYGLGLKGVTKKDIKIIRKYFPIRKFYRKKGITEEQVFEVYYKAKAEHLSRLVQIIEFQDNKDRIVEELKGITMRDLNNIIGSLQKIIKAKRKNKSKSDMKNLIRDIIAEYEESNPEWFDESPSTRRRPIARPRRRRRGPRRRFRTEEKLKF